MEAFHFVDGPSAVYRVTGAPSQEQAERTILTTLEGLGFLQPHLERTDTPPTTAVVLSLVWRPERGTTVPLEVLTRAEPYNDVPWEEPQYPSKWLPWSKGDELAIERQISRDELCALSVNEIRARLGLPPYLEG